nr:molybdopterin-dependent oxidoreductase [Chloroflexia bacterium]
GTAAPEGGYPPALIYQTAAHETLTSDGDDPGAIAAACLNLSLITGNVGRAGGGVANLRGPANYQGVTDMGAHPRRFGIGSDLTDPAARDAYSAAWLPRWAERATTRNGFVPVRELPSGQGLGLMDLPAAIASGKVTAMYVEGTIAGRHLAINQPLLDALATLPFLVVADSYPSPLTEIAHVVLPKSLYLEKDGTFTSFDRTVQRVRSVVPPMGEAKSGTEIIQALAKRFGYGLDIGHPARLMTEIAGLVPDYAGISYARLERGGMSIPATPDPSGLPVTANARFTPIR